MIITTIIITVIIIIPVVVMTMIIIIITMTIITVMIITATITSKATATPQCSLGAMACTNASMDIVSFSLLKSLVRWVPGVQEGQGSEGCLAMPWSRRWVLESVDGSGAEPSCCGMSLRLLW